MDNDITKEPVDNGAAPPPDTGTVDNGTIAPDVQKTAEETAASSSAADETQNEHAGDVEQPKPDPTAQKAADPQVQSLIEQAKADVRDQVDNAVTAAEKLLQIAAGDVDTLLTEGEAAAISIVVHNAPPQFQPVVSAFASVAASAEAGFNAAVDTNVHRGLAWSLSWLKTLQAKADEALG